MRRPRVTVWYRAKSEWCVAVDAPLHLSHEWATVIVATYETCDAANAYAKPLRRALAGGG